MNAVVLYATRSGNTRRVAEAIADGLRSMAAIEVASIDAAPVVPAGTDLVVIGGPTEGRRMVPPMLGFLERLSDLALSGLAAAAFDTRLDWPRWLSGSAAEGIRRELERKGARTPVATASFLVSMKPELEPGELARARAWGASLAASTNQHVVAGVAG